MKVKKQVWKDRQDRSETTTMSQAFASCTAIGDTRARLSPRLIEMEGEDRGGLALSASQLWSVARLEWGWDAGGSRITERKEPFDGPLASSGRRQAWPAPCQRQELHRKATLSTSPVPATGAAETAPERSTYPRCCESVNKVADTPLLDTPRRGAVAVACH